MPDFSLVSADLFTKLMRLPYDAVLCGILAGCACRVITYLRAGRG